MKEILAIIFVFFIFMGINKLFGFDVAVIGLLTLILFNVNGLYDKS